MTRMFRLKDEAAWDAFNRERNTRFGNAAGIVNTDQPTKADAAPRNSSTCNTGKADHAPRASGGLGQADTASSGPLYALVALCKAHQLPEPTPEYQFHPTRRWRADYAFIHTTPRVIVEIDGGVWAQGRHTRGAGFIQDQVKLNAAALLGYHVLRYTPDRLGECIADLRILFAKGSV